MYQSAGCMIDLISYYCELSQLTLAFPSAESWLLQLISDSLSYSWIWPNFLSYLLSCELNLVEILEIMAQMEPYIIFLSLKPTKMTSDFILNYLKKVIGGATTQKY